MSVLEIRDLHVSVETDQGSKQILLGDHRYWYNSAHYLIATTTLPIASRVAEASEENVSI